MFLKEKEDILRSSSKQPTIRRSFLGGKQWCSNARVSVTRSIPKVDIFAAMTLSVPKIERLIADE